VLNLAAGDLCKEFFGETISVENQKGLLVVLRNGRG
jgi:hypothetical protein